VVARAAVQGRAQVPELPQAHRMAVRPEARRGAGTDMRPRRSAVTGAFRRGDDMAPLVIPEERVYLRRSRQW
jgi:hypothetical protein